MPNEYTMNNELPEDIAAFLAEAALEFRAAMAALPPINDKPL